MKKTDDVNSRLLNVNPPENGVNLFLLYGR